MSSRPISRRNNKDRKDNGAISQSASDDSSNSIGVSTVAARRPLHLSSDSAVAGGTVTDLFKKEDNSDDSTSSEEDNKGWLVTSCDVGTAEPQSLSEELDRLQVLKSYHMIDPEREKSFDRLTTLASRVLNMPAVFLSLVDMGRMWFRCNPESDTEEQLSRDLLGRISRVILKQNDVFVITDLQLDEHFRQPGPNRESPNEPPFRFFSGAPLLSPEGYRLGAFCMLGNKPRPKGISEAEREYLKDFAVLAVKIMVDRRKLTTQGNPSHLVAATAHDLITPLTGIQLSLSLLQQDADFQAKLGDKRKEFLSGAVGSSNMMLRICQSTIETLRGKRKMSAATDWPLPRNLMQIAEASPFIDMKEFAANLQLISNSIPKRAPLKIYLHPSTPDNIVSDGLKIFRAALNLLSNACTRTESGFIKLTIQDDQDGFLLFECEDTGKDVEARDSQALFSQDSSPSNFGLYSVAYQVSWLGGKYGVRKRDSNKPPSSGNLANTKTDSVASNMAPPRSLKKHSHTTGAVFWFSVPIVLPQDVSELMGLAKTLSDNSEMTSVPTFKADLPQTPPASPLVDSGQEPSDSPDIPTGVVTSMGETNRTFNALIIEDSTTIRKILGRALSKLGYQVFEAEDGMEGLRELKVTLFDMVLCDFLMPVMDGLDCVQQYRDWEVTHRQTFRQYIIGISAHASRKDIERGLKLGMDDFKPKPIVLKTLKSLHESPKLTAVRSNLNNLLNLPSLLVKERDPVDTSHLSAKSAQILKQIGSARNGLTSMPAEATKKMPSKHSALLSIATNLVENERQAALLSTSISTSKEDDKKLNAPNSAVTEKEESALFSLATNLAQDESKKPALFEFPTNSITSLVGEENNEKSSIPKPIPDKVDGKAQILEKKPELFSVAPNRASSEAEKNEKQMESRAALFAIPSNTKEMREAKPPPLFALPCNTLGKTSDSDEVNPGSPSVLESGDTMNAEKIPPLFSIPETSLVNAVEGMNMVQSPANPAALFDIRGRNGTTSTATTTQATAKRPALLDIPGTSSSTSAVREVPESESRGKKRPLFDISSRSSEEK